MPGIVGLVTKMPRAWAEPQLLRMVQSIRHESFYETGTGSTRRPEFMSDGWRRKNSFSWGMPVRNERVDVTLIFSGEEFPEPGTADRLRQKGQDVNPAGLAYLVHLYEDDPTFPACLNGRFQGSSLTERGVTRRSSMIVMECTGRTISNPKRLSILRSRRRRSSLSGRSCGRSIVEDLESLLRAAGAREPNAVRRHSGVTAGFGMDFSRRQAGTESELFSASRMGTAGTPVAGSLLCRTPQVFARNLPRYFDGNERVGLSLTGGLDSRMILAWHKAAPNTLPCYTFGGTYRDCQDVVVSREVARACNQPYEVIPLGTDFLSRFGDYAERAVYLSDGCVRVNRGADLYLNELARTIAPVRMTGNYGSEVLRWVPAFKPVRPDGELFATDFLPVVNEASDTYQRVLQGHPVSLRYSGKRRGIITDCWGWN